MPIHKGLKVITAHHKQTKNFSKAILSTLSFFSVQNQRTRKVDKVYNIADKVVCEKIDCIASTGNQ